MSTLISPIVSAILMPLLVISPVWAQTPVPLTDSPADAASIQLRMIDSDGTQARVNSRAERGFTLQVTDATGATISDAAIAFRLPDNGATGIFPDGTHSTVVYTDVSGRAHVSGILWGETPGPLAIRVTATKGASHAGILIEQTLFSATELASATAATALPVSPLPSAPPPMPIPGTVRATTTGASASVPSAPIAPLSNVSIAQAKPEPSVSVTSASPGSSQHSSKTKWLIVAAIAAGAGVGAAMALKGKSSTTSASSSTVSIGSPTVSVGHP